MVRLLCLAACIMLAIAGPVSAVGVSETVETPAGTYHVSGDAGTVGRIFCVIWVGATCIGVILPSPYAGASVLEETNGCEGPQRNAGPCPATGQWTEADRRIV